MISLNSYELFDFIIIAFTEIIGQTAALPSLHFLAIRHG